MSSHIEILSVSIDTVVGAEDELLFIGQFDRKDTLMLRLHESNNISLFLAVVSSNIVVATEFSATIVSGEDVKTRSLVLDSARSIAQVLKSEFVSFFITGVSSHIVI